MTDKDIKKTEEEGKLDLSIYDKDDKGRYIVPEEIIKECYKVLPSGTHTPDGSYTAYNGGLLKMLTAEDRSKGGKVRQEQKAKVESFASAIKRALYSNAKATTCDSLGLPRDSSLLECIITTQSLLASDTKGKGSTKAAEFLRDTIGEQPVAKQELTADIITPEERALLAKVKARLEGKTEDQGKDTE